MVKSYRDRVSQQQKQKNQKTKIKKHLKIPRLTSTSSDSEHEVKWEVVQCGAVQAVTNERSGVRGVSVNLVNSRLKFNVEYLSIEYTSIQFNHFQ